MQRHGIGALVGVALGLAAVPCARAATLNVAGDAQTSSSHPNTKFGVLPLMTVRSGPSGTICNSYAQFDLAALPNAPTVDKAVLRLWVGAVLTPGTIEVVPLLDPWQEATLTANASPLPGTPVTSFTVSGADALHFVNVDVTGLVRDWTTGSMANHGLALVGTGSVNVVFDTKESVVFGQSPELEVILASQGHEGPPGPQGEQGPKGDPGEPGAPGTLPA